MSLGVWLFNVHLKKTNNVKWLHNYVLYFVIVGIVITMVIDSSQ